MVEVQGSVAPVAGLAERVRPIGVCGHRTVGAAQVGRNYLLGGGERFVYAKGRKRMEGGGGMGGWGGGAERIDGFAARCRR